ncbi:tRNA (5-methylaminomethyl-2-thiouridine)(34)-methyltransferase MnmD [Peredibacter starrii]|uniref:MnmC family methyltransferase n=1 Tax=Peredibacter starrii TaxID=28202 RepID=A0AAX4HJL9_9BACT|nr:MnmC family methyltransferase [Peredibacter starrii]WPU63441.1 MnmC family methyltransferase [Peredibacter starrii]
MSNGILPPGHTLVETQDGSFTLFSEAFQEACHSTTGARAETLLHYVEGCQIVSKLRQHSPLNILEVGFGLGIGFLTTLEVVGTERPWHFISMEIDRNLLEWFRQKFSDHSFLKNLQWKKLGDLEVLEAEALGCKLTILCGDGRKTLPMYVSYVAVKWHAIYQDAFSPKRNPILWTKEWFKFLKEHADHDVILSTYSASTSIRKSLTASGWQVKKGEKFGPKRTSTRATLTGETDPEIILQMERSPALVLSDSNINDFLTK